MQDNSEADSCIASSTSGNRLRRIVHWLIKRPAYRRVVRNADRIVLNVPETRQIIEPWLGAAGRLSLERKAIQLRLGFDPYLFFFDAEARQAWRISHNVNDRELLLVTCTRAVPRKRLEEVIDSVSAIRADGITVRYVLAGLLDDAYGRRLLRYAEEQPDPKAFVLLSVLQQEEMRRVFSASDLGFWPQAAITIQQAMGTGLPVVLRQRPTVSHLLQPGKNGWYVGKRETIAQALAGAIGRLAAVVPSERLSRRRQIADLNRSYLCYDVIAQEMLDHL
jgi:glycosyltransferase involved in cell wall biosynthesis